MRNLTIAVLLAALPILASAHHSVAALYDFDDVQEVSGTITDSEVFTEPVVFNGYMEWFRGEEFKPYNCTY